MFFLRSNSSLKLLLFFCGINFFVLQLTSSQASANANYLMPPMKKNERLKLFEKYVLPYDYTVTNFSRNSSPDSCLTDMERIKAGYDLNIMDAIMVLWDENLKEFKDFHKCPDEFNVDVFSAESPNSDLNAIRFAMKSTHLELYDAQKPLGFGFYGLLTEGGRPVCNKERDKICSEMISFETRAKIIDFNSCKIQDNFVTLSPRLKISVYKAKNEIKEHKTNNFNAFFDGGNALYEISFRTNHLQGEICTSEDRCNFFREGTDLFLKKYTN